MSANLKNIFSRSRQVLRNRQVTIVRHVLRPFIVIATMVLLAIYICLFFTSELKPSLLIQLVSLVVALYALYRTTTFHGKVTFGTIPAIPSEISNDTRAEVIGCHKFIITNSFNSIVYAQIQTVNTLDSSVEVDLTQFPVGIIMAPSSVSEMKAIIPIVAGSKKLTISVSILVLLSSGRKIEKTIFLLL
jgi:hypothetical protein